MLEIALDLNARLETLDSHISASSSTPKGASTPPSQVFIVAYLTHNYKAFCNSIFKVQFPKKLHFKTQTSIKNHYA